jgi:hypothetical protein
LFREKQVMRRLPEIVRGHWGTIGWYTAMSISPPDAATLIVCGDEPRFEWHRANVC